MAFALPELESQGPVAISDPPFSPFGRSSSETRTNLPLHSCPSLVCLTTKVDRSLPPSPSRDLPSPFFHHRPTIIVPTAAPNQSFPLLFNRSNRLPASPPKAFPLVASSSPSSSSTTIATVHEIGPISSLSIDHNEPSFISTDAAKLPSSTQTGLHQTQRHPHCLLHLFPLAHRPAVLLLAISYPKQKRRSEPKKISLTADLKNKGNRETGLKNKIVKG